MLVSNNYKQFIKHYIDLVHGADATEVIAELLQDLFKFILITCLIMCRAYIYKSTVNPSLLGNDLLGLHSNFISSQAF